MIHAFGVCVHDDGSCLCEVKMNGSCLQPPLPFVGLGEGKDLAGLAFGDLRKI